MARMARPFVIVAGILAFFTGACMAFWSMEYFPLESGAAGLLIMVASIIMGHYANEYADFETDSITRRTAFSGGSGVLPSGIIPRRWALYAALVFLLIALALTVLFYSLGLISWGVVALVTAGLPLGWFYSMPPLRLERTWAGELDNAILGTMMMLMGYVAAAGHFDIYALGLSVPIFLAVLFNLLGVHYADRAADEMVGKRTMAVVLGPRTNRLFIVLTAIMCASLIPLFFVFPISVAVACLATIPVAIWAVLGFYRSGGPHYGSILMGSLFIFAAIGFILA